MRWYNTKCWVLLLALAASAALVEAAPTEMPSSHVHAAHVRPAPFKRWERRSPLGPRLRVGPGGNLVLESHDGSLVGDTGQGEDAPAS